MPRRAGSYLFLAALGWLTAPQPATAAPFVVMSYNIANWLTTDRTIGGKRSSAAPKPETEKDAVTSIIVAHKPDVLGICEIGSRDDLEDLRSRLKARGLDYPHAAWNEGIDKERHVALLSRFPIVAHHDTQKPATFDIDGHPQAIQRGILDVTVEPQRGYSLRLIGLHLKSRRPVPDVDQEALRAKEAWFVRKHIDAILEKDPGAKLLLFGDLNTTRDDYPIKHIQNASGSPARLSDIRVEDDRGERWTHYYVAADEYSRIDYLMASPALRPDVVLKKSGIDSSPEWQTASDHRAIFATIHPK
jgi:endonuclease/exonuclease/phosphatase family metal-dependent hydrolase